MRADEAMPIASWRMYVALRACLWLPLSHAPAVAGRLAHVPAGTRSEVTKQLLHEALLPPGRRNLPLLRAYRRPAAIDEVTPARIQLRLNPYRSRRELELFRYFRAVPAQRRGFEAIRLLTALISLPLDAPSHSWRTTPAQLYATRTLAPRFKRPPRAPRTGV